MNMQCVFAAVIVLAMLPLPAHAQSPLTMHNSAALPPLEYDRPYEGKLNVVTVGAAVMRRACPRSSLPITLACSFAEKDECLIIMLEDNLIVNPEGKSKISYDNRQVN